LSHLLDKSRTRRVPTNFPFPKPGDKHFQEAQEEAERLAQGPALTKFPQKKEWMNNDFCTTIQHWDYIPPRQTRETVNEAEAALLDMASG
jgi:hypothetical protein